MYGYLKVIDPNSNLPKFVFVNWVNIALLFCLLVFS